MFLRWLISILRLTLEISIYEAALESAAAFGMTLTPGRLGELASMIPGEQIAGVLPGSTSPIGPGMRSLMRSAGYRGVSPLSWGLLTFAALAIAAIICPLVPIEMLSGAYSIV